MLIAAAKRRKSSEPGSPVEDDPGLKSPPTKVHSLIPSYVPVAKPLLDLKQALGVVCSMA